MLRELYVYAHLESAGWVPAGLLQYEETGRFSSSTFRYGKKYLERHDRIELDPIQLPLQDGTFVTPEGFSLFNGIRDAGPDKWGRYLLDKKFARSLTELEYVAATGPDRVGALAFSDDPASGPKIYTPTGFHALDSKHLDLAFCVGALNDLEASKETERLKQYLQYGPSLGGARPKATVIWKGRPHLAKFSLSLDSRNEPRVEFATMTLAQKCGLRVSSVATTEVSGWSIYLIERFDRRPDGSPIPFISGLTLTGCHESDYSTWSYHGLVDAIVKHSSQVEQDLRELFQRMVFNILVYNNDDHLRNFGFLRSGRDRWDLSPLYDVVPASVNSQSYSLAMVIGTDGKKASITNAVSQCERFRLMKEEAGGIIARLKIGVASWREHFKGAGVKDHELKALENSFSEKP
ncbi:type II toxin-antitoxin system HipA family toxin [Bdellovibrionota bacterium FG-1]